MDDLYILLHTAFINSAQHGLVLVEKHVAVHFMAPAKMKLLVKSYIHDRGGGLLGGLVYWTGHLLGYYRAI